MSIATEITRLQNAKTSIKAAIEGKGVSVPADTHLDGMAALIDTIQSGGADLSGLSWTTVTSETTTLRFTLPPSGWSKILYIFQVSSGGFGIGLARWVGSDIATMSIWQSSWRIMTTMDGGPNFEVVEQGDMMWGGGAPAAVLAESKGAYAIIE